LLICNDIKGYLFPTTSNGIKSCIYIVNGCIGDSHATPSMSDNRDNAQRITID
jgi:competence transcription factor ComK